MALGKLLSDTFRIDAQLIPEATLRRAMKADKRLSRDHRDFGGAWYEERRSVVLIVPSVVTRKERNFVLNASRPEFPRITAAHEVPVYWDDRLYSP